MAIKKRFIYYFFFWCKRPGGSKYSYNEIYNNNNDGIKIQLQVHNIRVY